MGGGLFRNHQGINSSFVHDISVSVFCIEDLNATKVLVSYEAVAGLRIIHGKTPPLPNFGLIPFLNHHLDPGSLCILSSVPARHAVGIWQLSSKEVMIS